MRRLDTISVSMAVVIQLAGRVCAVLKHRGDQGL